MGTPLGADEHAHTLGAFRACRHGDAITYDATLESSSPQAVAAITNALRRHGHLSNCDGTFASHDRCFAVLDLIDDRGHWLDTACIPDHHRFNHIRRTLALRITNTDCEHGCH